MRLPPRRRRGSHLSGEELAHFGVLLRNGFRIKNRSSVRLAIECTRCAESWSIPRDNRHGGSLLVLLNHAREHDGGGRQ